VIGIAAFDETSPFNSVLGDEIFGRFQTDPLQRIESRLSATSTRASRAWCPRTSSA